jgi:hypothetical protein
MPKFQILRPVEHNQILYVRPGATEAVRARSAGHGGEIPVDASGTIDLEAPAAEAFTRGQIAPVGAASTEAPSPKRAKR